jgi:hypothetical protein
MRRSESTRFSSASDDKVGGLPARSAASGSEQIKQRKNASARFSSVRRRAIPDARSQFWTARAMSDCSLRSRGSRFEAAAFHSLADERRVCSLVRPGQRRVILGARKSSAIPDARSKFLDCSPPAVPAPMR